MISLCIVAALELASPTGDTLLPRPAEISYGSQGLALGEVFAVETTGPHSQRVSRAIERFSERMAQEYGVHVCTARCDAPHKLRIQWEKHDPALSSPLGDESYTLLIDTHHAVLRATDTVGILRGLETLAAWTQDTREGPHWAAVHIHDKPRFVWRGLLLDVARHFMPVEVIKRNLDAMAAVKMNVLHWHLTDDQGFRIESRRFPELHRQGSQGDYYTQEQVRDILHYASDRGIRVVPEFDMPGHVQSWLVSHPELAAQHTEYSVGTTWGIYDTALDPSREETYIFLDAFLKEMAGLFPDAYVHLGGDEVVGKQWLESTHVRAFMSEHRIYDAHGLQTYFFNRVSTLAHKHHKQVIGWDEVLQPGLHHTTAVESWRGRQSLADALRSGHNGILAEGYYLDGNDSAGKYYGVDPTADLELTAEERAHLLGGEACQWSELVTAQTLDLYIWPRAAAIAERLWSDASVTDQADLYRRLDALSASLHHMGITHRSVQEKMLAALAGTPYTGPLEELVAVLEPDRANWHPGYDVANPLNSLVDTLTPESLQSRDITLHVERLLQAPAGLEGDSELTATFVRLREAMPHAEAIMRRGPSLQNALPIVAMVSETSDIALEALDYLRAAATGDESLNTPVVRTWVKHARHILRGAEGRHQSMRIAYLPAVQKLVDAVAAQSEGLVGKSTTDESLDDAELGE